MHFTVESARFILYFNMNIKLAILPLLCVPLLALAATDKTIAIASSVPMASEAKIAKNIKEECALGTTQV